MFKVSLASCSRQASRILSNTGRIVNLDNSFECAALSHHQNCDHRLTCKFHRSITQTLCITVHPMGRAFSRSAAATSSVRLPNSTKPELNSFHFISTTVGYTSRAHCFPHAFLRPTPYFPISLWPSSSSLVPSTISAFMCYLSLCYLNTLQNMITAKL